MLDIKQIAVDILKDKIESLKLEDIYEMLEYPPNPDMGDVALPCFKLSRIFRKSPAKIAEELADSINLPDSIEKVA